MCAFFLTTDSQTQSPVAMVDIVMLYNLLVDELSQGLSQAHITDEHSTQDSEGGDVENTGSLSQSQGHNGMSRCRGKVSLLCCTTMFCTQRI